MLDYPTTAVQRQQILRRVPSRGSGGNFGFGNNINAVHNTGGGVGVGGVHYRIHNTMCVYDNLFAAGRGPFGRGMLAGYGDPWESDSAVVYKEIQLTKTRSF